MNEKMNFDLNDLKDLLNKIIDGAADEANKARAQKERRKCKEAGPNSIENRLMAVEAKQDIIIEDLNFFSKMLFELKGRLEDIQQDNLDDFDCEDSDLDCDACDCEGCEDCRECYKHESEDKDDRVKTKDDLKKEVINNILNILDAFRGLSEEDDGDIDFRINSTGDIDSEAVEEDSPHIVNEIKDIFKGVPIVFAYDGKDKVYTAF